MEKKNRKIEMICVAILAILVIALGVTMYLRKNVITNVNKVLSDKYDEIKCVNDNCDFIKVADYKKNKVYIYDSDGNKVSKYTESNSKTLYDATPEYLLFKNIDKNGEIKEYYVTRVNGKKVYSSKNELAILTDYLVEEFLDGSSNVINYKGKTLYSNITKLKRYRNVSSIKVLDEEYLIDKKGERTLSDYIIDKEVIGNDGETMYLVLQDSSGAYYYFDAKTEKFKGDSFNSYIFNENNKTITAYKDTNGGTVILDINKKGDQKESEEESQVKVLKKMTPLIDESKYRIYQKALYSNLQTKVLVDNLVDNSFGIFDINKKEYKELYKYTSEKGSSIIISFKSYDNNKYYQINCSESMCGENKITIYDSKNGKVLFDYVHGENKIRNFTGLKGGYKLVLYTGDSTEDFSNKYVLYNAKNEIITKSSNLITVVDKEILFGKKYSDEEAIIYSAKLNKVFNTDENLARINKVNGVKIYAYDDAENTYLVSETGKEVLKVKNTNSNLVYTKDLIMNINDKKVTLVNANNGNIGSYTFKKNESVLGNNDQTILSFKKSIFVNNKIDKYYKIINYTGNKFRKIKKTNISEVHQSKQSKNIIIISTNGEKFGFYIAK